MFADGMKDGKGTSFFKDGNPIFEGYWRKDQPWKGKGLHLNKDLKVKYEGDWSNGNYDGKGTKYQFQSQNYPPDCSRLDRRPGLAIWRSLLWLAAIGALCLG